MRKAVIILTLVLLPTLANAIPAQELPAADKPAERQWLAFVQPPHMCFVACGANQIGNWWRCCMMVTHGLAKNLDSGKINQLMTALDSPTCAREFARASKQAIEITDDGSLKLSIPNSACRASVENALGQKQRNTELGNGNRVQ